MPLEIVKYLKTIGMIAKSGPGNHNSKIMLHLHNFKTESIREIQLRVVHCGDLRDERVFMQQEGRQEHKPGRDSL
jgi:hypothetical protein